MLKAPCRDYQYTHTLKHMHARMHQCTHTETHTQTRGKTIKPNLDTGLPLFQTSSISTCTLFKCPTAALTALTALTGRSGVCTDVSQLQATPVAQFYFGELDGFLHTAINWWNGKDSCNLLFDYCKVSCFFRKSQLQIFKYVSKYNKLLY